MKLWPFLSLLILVPPLCRAGQRVENLAESGEDALANQLWDVAESRFRDCLADRSLPANEKPALTLRLCEALVRGRKYEKALELVNSKILASQPDTAFWKAQALAGLGRLPAAIDSFEQQLKNPAAAHRAEAIFSQANLQRTLDQSTQAIATLKRLATDSNPQIVAQSQLQQVVILLDLQRPAEARRIMPTVQLTRLTDQKLAEFLEAKLRFAEGRLPEATASYQALVNAAQGQSLEQFHAAILGLADAKHAAGDHEFAISSLLAFVQENPDSPALETIFKRFGDWLPETPTSSEPILQQLAQWIPAIELPTYGLIANAADATQLAAAAPWQKFTAPSNRSIFSMFTRAIGLHRIASAEAKSEAQHLLTRLRFENPNHPLADQALYQLARWQLEKGDATRAAAIFELVRDGKKSSSLQGRSAFLSASAAFSEGNLPLAARLFKEAALYLDDAAKTAARFNEAVTRLQNGDLKGVTLIQQSEQSPANGLTQDLQLQRALAMPLAADSKKALTEFITQNPDSSELPPAQLAAAEAALAMSPPDLAFARSQLDLLDANPAIGTALPAIQLALTRLRVADLSDDSAATIALARKILETYPSDPKAADAALTLGRNLLKVKDYNPARLVLEKLAATDADPARAQAAWLLAARSAALVGTLSSKEEALVLFDKTIASNGSLAAIARLEKADHLIKSMYRFGEAAELLRDWLKSLPKNDTLRLPAGLLLGQALYAEGATSPNSLREALAIYDQLLPFSNEYPALVHRLQYLRGLALEQLPDEKDPLQKREAQAFIAYYSVLETTEPPSEWEYFELCGFKALSLKERSAEWRAAIAVAEKITRFKGPRAAEAATRAKQLKLTHLIWDDGPLEPDP